MPFPYDKEKTWIYFWTKHCCFVYLNWLSLLSSKICFKNFHQALSISQNMPKRVYQITHSSGRIPFHDRPLRLLLHKANSSFCVSTYKTNISFGSSCLVSMLTDCKIACPHKTSVEHHKSFCSTTFIPGAFYRVIKSMWREQCEDKWQQRIHFQIISCWE